MCRSAARDILLTLAAGYDGKDRSYLEAWGIGATHKEEALYVALAASQAPADATSWPIAYADLVWRLTPRAAVPAFAARASAAGLTAGGRANKATTALGFIATADAANALLEVAQHGGGDIKQNPALWWLINYKDSRWAGTASTPSSRAAGSTTRTRSRSMKSRCRCRRKNPRCPPWLTSPNYAAMRNVARPPRAPVSCATASRGRASITHRRSTASPSRQTRDVVITAIVNPSNDIAHGYEGAEITLTDGRKIHGLVLSGGNPLIVQSTGGVTQMIPASQVKERKRLGRSLMLSADQLGLTAQQVADISGLSALILWWLRPSSALTSGISRRTRRPRSWLRARQRLRHRRRMS